MSRTAVHKGFLRPVLMLVDWARSAAIALEPSFCKEGAAFAQVSEEQLLIGLSQPATSSSSTPLQPWPPRK